MRGSSEMAEPASSGAAAAGIALSKLAPAGMAALVMVAVGPKTVTRKEIFVRALVAMALSHLFGDVAVAYVGSLGWHWFNPATHASAVYGFIGAFGWGVVGGFALLSQRFRRDPLGVATKVRKAIKGES
jgi:hypothetical protein